MCGFAGFLGGVARESQAAEESLLRSLADTIKHRGPDDSGYWCDQDRRIGLCLRRLSIVDLSQAGHQPMHSASERYVIVYNGEIYNHVDLRKALDASLKSHPWRGHSDTETLLAGFDAWGIEATLNRAVGMFAFGVWDRREHTLTLARDRIGEKPLYYGWQGGGSDAVFLFGSELKALRAHPAFENRIDRNALNLLLRHNCIPAPYSIYQGIFKLRPGHLLTVSLAEREPRTWAYWSAAQAARSGVANPFAGSDSEAIDALEEILTDAVGRQMMADVPLGAFLSGGVDSSTVVALMQAQSPRPVKTFTIGFHEAGYDEAGHAKAVAAHLGTDHTELYISAEQAMAVIPALPTMYDEPFSDSSQIPTFLVSQLARERVTVSLSGDGGDELFGGYNRYAITARLWNGLGYVPPALREMMAKGLNVVSLNSWNRIASAVENWLPRSARPTQLGNFPHKAAGVLASRSPEELYFRLVSHWQKPESVVLGGHEPPTLVTSDAPDLEGLDDVQRMMALDIMTYLPDDILVKLDRAAMAVSLEARVPFLDHRVVEFAWHLPQVMKIRRGQTKWALRQVLSRHVPSSLIERQKKGFGIPLDAWLRGPLRGWAEDMLDESRLMREGYFDPAPIRWRWKEHLSGRRNWQHHLWDVLMFQAWLESQRSQ